MNNDEGVASVVSNYTSETEDCNYRSPDLIHLDRCLLKESNNEGFTQDIRLYIVWVRYSI